MNVDDIKGDVIPVVFKEFDRLDLIFARQHILMEKYIPIEVGNKLRHTTDCPVDLHDRHGQAQLKDFFWRATEELTEACEANRIHPELKSHTLEELADALHFIVEACLLAGFVAKDYDYLDDCPPMCKLEHQVKHADPRDLECGCFEVMYLLGAASNCLKNRPWKQNHQLVDVTKFHNLLGQALPALIDVFVGQGLSADEIFRMYWKKSEVNKFRQRSNY